MPRLGSFPVWLLGILVLAPLHSARAGDDRETAVAATLAVQTAMQQGREYLLRNDAKAAVYVLESQLTRINGNTAYLALLRDAYRAYIQELRLANQTAAVQLYTQRLKILDPGATIDLAAATPQPPAPTKPAAPDKPAAPPQAKTATPPAPVIRATMEETAADTAPPEKIKPTLSLLARAEEEFSHRHFKEAGSLFEEANKTDPAALAASHERWAYCKLFRVVEQMNQPPAGGPAWAELEKEVRQAIEMAPRLDYGKYLLEEIQKRRKPTAPEAEAPAVAVKHQERGADGWARAETTNFRILHNQSREFAEKVAQAAERTRLAMHQKWLGGQPEAWTPRCDLYLHATAAEYSKATGKSEQLPGHSTITSERSRVVARRIDLRCDEAALLTVNLPHETTHVVLAGQFGEQPVPRWADEGVAVLTEPRERVDRHLRNLPRLRQDGQLFKVGQLLQLNDYPEPKQITAFYAQSISLVEFLTTQKGPQVFSQFLRDALRGGYEPALQKHYGFRSFDELQQAWAQKAFDASVTGSGLARTTP